MKGTLLAELIGQALDDAELLHANLVVARECACSNPDFGHAPCDRMRNALRLRNFMDELDRQPSPRADADFPSSDAERTHQLGVEVYGPEVLHPRHPVAILSVPTGQLVLADPYDVLIETFQLVASKVQQRRDG